MSTTHDEEKAAPARRPLWKRLLILAGVLALVCAVVGFPLSALDRERASSEHAAALRRIDEEEPGGWRLEDLEEARPDVPPGKNSALVVEAARKLLPAAWPPEPVSRDYGERAANEAPQPGLLAALDRELKKVEPALREARRLADLPLGRHPIVYNDDPLRTLLPHAQKSRDVAALLSYDSDLLAARGDIDGALRSARGAVNAGRSLDDEPFAISQLVRNACVQLGMRAAERALGQGQAGGAELAALQALLAEEEKHPTYLVSMRGERAVMDKLMRGLIAGRYPVRETIDVLMGGGQASRPDQPAYWYRRWLGFSRTDLRRQHTQMLGLLTRAVQTARLPPHEQEAEERKLSAEISAVPNSLVLVRLLAPSLRNIGKGHRRKLAWVSSMRVLLAVERYRLAEGKWPDRLEDLPAGLLDAVPPDPFDGKPLRYRRLPDGVVVYSVGEDGTDDGGNVDPRMVAKPGGDLGFRLYDPGRRKQPPRPRPAGAAP